MEPATNEQFFPDLNTAINLFRVENPSYKTYEINKLIAQCECYPDMPQAIFDLLEAIKEFRAHTSLDMFAEIRNQMMQAPELEKILLNIKQAFENYLTRIANISDSLQQKLLWDAWNYCAASAKARLHELKNNQDKIYQLYADNKNIQ